ncbi:MAG: branched-chain amino acid ABC transporter permease [Acidimicrobiia bacterium]
MSATDLSTKVADRVARMVPRPRVYARRQRESILVGAVVLAMVPLFVHGLYGLDVANTAMISTLLASGFYIQFALAGQFSLGTSSFYGIGAFTSVWAGQKGGGFIVGIIVAAIVTGIIGTLVKLILYRSPLLQFAIATLAFATLSQIILRQWESFTGGEGGSFGIEKPSLFGKEFVTPTETFYLSGGVALLGIVLLVLLERSATQRDWVFTKNQPIVAKVSGVPTLRAQAVAFGVGAAYMGAAGAVASYTRGFVSLNQFHAGVSLDVLIMVLVGGVASVWGPAVGAVVIILTPEWLRRIADYRELVFAAVILVVILAIPEGITSLPRRIIAWQQRKRSTPAAGSSSGTDQAAPSSLTAGESV